MKILILKKRRYIISSNIIITLGLGIKMRLATRLIIRLILGFLRINPWEGISLYIIINYNIPMFLGSWKRIPLVKVGIFLSGYYLFRVFACPLSIIASYLLSKLRLTSRLAFYLHSTLLIERPGSRNNSFPSRSKQT